MQETAKQYTERILGYLDGKKPMEVLAATPRQIGRLVKGVPRKRLSQRPAVDTWSVTEILAHLADSEMVYGYRIRMILEANGIPIQATDQDAWARFSEYGKQDPALSLQAIRVGRERTIRLLKGLPKESWERYGTHSERGKETVARVVEMLAGHDLNHLRQIRERLPRKR
ncbi:MAG TPA: DinB family protein [Spirochaetia bacterium]|nr:DinB family protein [Spirochaetia bacterium]